MTDEPQAKTESMSYTKMVAIIVGGLSVVISSVVSGVLVWWLTRAEPHLTYAVDEPISFEGNSNKISIVYVSIVNDGSDKAEDFSFSVQLANARLKEVRISPEALKLQPTAESVSHPAPTSPEEVPAFYPAKYEASLPYLNQGESIRLSLLTENRNALLRRDVVVNARAKGATAVEGTPGTSGQGNVSIAPFTLLTAVLSLIAGGILGGWATLQAIMFTAELLGKVDIGKHIVTALLAFKEEKAKKGVVAPTSQSPGPDQIGQNS